jgi:hypothetical protein
VVRGMPRFGSDKKNQLDGLWSQHYASLRVDRTSGRPALARGMKLTGFLLLLAGWGIILSAVALLRSAAPRAVFVLAGLGVEALGLILVVRSHPVLRGE